MEVLYRWLQVTFVIPLWLSKLGTFSTQFIHHFVWIFLIQAFISTGLCPFCAHDHGCSLILCLHKPFWCCFSHFSSISGNLTCKRPKNIECLEACLLWIPCDLSLRSCFRSNIVQSYHIQPYTLFKMAISMYTLCLQEHWRRQNTIHL